jgi:polyisoprenoid-binding protein YceI
VGQFFSSNVAPAGARRGPWSRDLPRSWQAALGLTEEPAPLPAEDGAHRLGPSDGTLSLRTGRGGAAAKAGHDLLIRVTRWEAVLAIGDDADGSSLALDVDGGSLRVVEGSGGMKALTDSDKADIATTIDDEILKRERITFRSTQVRPSDDGTGLSVEGDLTLLGQTHPLAFDVALSEDGTITAGTVITQSRWGITPYSTLFGTLKVNDDVAVEMTARLPSA